MNEPELRFKADDGSDFPGWEEKTLSNICNIIGGGTPPTKQSDYWNGNIPWVSSADIEDNNIRNINKSRYITQEAINNSATKKIPKDSVLIVSRVGVGKVALADEELCTSQDYTNMVNLSEVPLFIAYYMSKRMQTEAINVQGTSIKGIPSKDIQGYLLKIPCEKEQQKIADLFFTLDNVINSVQKEVDSWRQMKRGVMQKLFSQEVRFKADDGTEFPEWEKKKLGDVFTERSERSKGNEELLSVTIASGVIQQSDSDKRNIASSDTSNYKIVYKGDLAYNTMRMWQGAEGVSDYNGIISPAYTVLICDENDDVEFFADMFKLKYMLNQFEKHSQGLTSDTWNLKYKHFSEIHVKVPCLEEQQKIADCLSEFDLVIEKAKQKLEAYKQLKKGLMQRMFI